jgi:hypothetical protein
MDVAGDPRRLLEPGGPQLLLLRALGLGEQQLRLSSRISDCLMLEPASATAAKPSE